MLVRFEVPTLAHSFAVKQESVTLKRSLSPLADMFRGTPLNEDHGPG